MRRRRRTRRGLIAAAAIASAAAGAWLGVQQRRAAVPPAPPIGPARTDEGSWNDLLRALSDLAIGNPRIRPLLTAPQVAARWLGEPPAEEEAIAAAETRLGLRLPDSYKAFLRISDGWHFPSPALGLLLPSARIPPLLAGGRALRVSRHDRAAGDSAVMLLQPGRIAAATGEMEAWIVADRTPAPAMHPSFWHAMEAAREALWLIRDRE